MNTQTVSVSPKHVQDLWSRGEQVDLVDVRTPLEYRTGHAVGAKLIPLDELRPNTLGSQLGRPDEDSSQPVYLICQSGARAQQAAERLLASGYRNVALVEGGTEAWEKAGLPMRRCGNVISLERQVQLTIGSLLVLKVFFGFTVHELFFAATALIGGGLIVAGMTRWCGLARLLALMPWNRRRDCAEHAPA